MKYRKRHIGGVNVLVQVVVLIAAVLLIGLLAYRQVQRILGNKTSVVVAAAPLAPGALLGESDLDIVEVPVNRVPPGTLSELDQAVGRIIHVGKSAGNAVVEADFTARAVTQGIQLSKLIPEGRVLTTLTLRNITISSKDLRQGDRVDVLAHRSSASSGAARLVVEDAYVVGFISIGGGAAQPRGRTLMGVNLQPALPSKRNTGAQRGLLLALHPDDVLPLAEVDGSGAHINLVLHSIQSVQSGTMLSVAAPKDPHNSVDLILGAKREKVILQ